MALLVSCTEKGQTDDARVSVIGGIARDGSHWKRGVAAAIAEIESGRETYYVNVEGRTPNLVVATRSGVKYLKSQLDGDVPKTLLGLPDC